LPSFLRTPLLLTEKPLIVGLTHGVEPASCAQSDGSAPPVATASARKNVPTANLAVNFPLVETLTRFLVVSFDFTDPPSTVTVAPARGCRPWVTAPTTVAPLPAGFAAGGPAP